MKTVHVHASTDYDILIGRGLLDSLGSEMKERLGLCRAALIADDTVFGICGERAVLALEKAGYDVISLVFPAGEASKSLGTFGNLLNGLCNASFSRNDVVVALGGGVSGDLAGFAAATYQRGIRYVQVPTTLLAMVDSSVGGKTAVDLDRGKNQAGCFWQPSLVLCDPELLSTLPERQVRCGIAEIVKYAMLGNPGFFGSLLETPVQEDYERVIETCVSMKRDLVAEDEFDVGRRQLLNFGHTFGHAVEAASGYEVLHGEAVAIGMSIMTAAAAAKGLCPLAICGSLSEALKKYGLPERTDFTVNELADAVKNDKKLRGSELSIVVPVAPGECRIRKIPAGSVPEWLRAGGVKD